MTGHSANRLILSLPCCPVPSDRACIRRQKLCDRQAHRQRARRKNDRRASRTEPQMLAHDWNGNYVQPLVDGLPATLKSPWPGTRAARTVSRAGKPANSLPKALRRPLLLMRHEQLLLFTGGPLGVSRELGGVPKVVAENEAGIRSCRLGNSCPFSSAVAPQLNARTTRSSIPGVLATRETPRASPAGGIASAGITAPLPPVPPSAPVRTPRASARSSPWGSSARAAYSRRGRSPSPEQPGCLPPVEDG